MADRVTLPKFVRHETLLRSGDRLDQRAFHALYERTPDDFKAELIGGIVYVASPTSYEHGQPHFRMATWLGTYESETPGVQGLDNTTNILGEESEPQPDLCLRIQPEYGGQTTNKKKCVQGPLELVVEIAYSSVAIDLHAKKRDYEKAGVREYLVVLARERKVVWFVRGKKDFSELKSDSDGVLRSRIFPGLWLDASAVFAPTSRRLLQTLREGLASPAHAEFLKELEARRKAHRRSGHRPESEGNGTVNP